MNRGPYTRITEIRRIHADRNGSLATKARGPLRYLLRFSRRR